MDLNAARKNFEQAIKEQQAGDKERVPVQLIDQILLGDHLTYRYALLTALLGKFTDESIHMRSLQAGSSGSVRNSSHI